MTKLSIYTDLGWKAIALDSDLHDAVTSFSVEGALAVATNVCSSIGIVSNTTIPAFYIYCKNPGTAGSTIVDVNKNGTTIYTTQGNRPTLAFDDTDGWSSSVPDITTFVEGDILTLDIDQIATGAEGLIVFFSIQGAGGAGSAGVFNLTVDDGVTTIQNINQISIDGGEVVDEGGGRVTITAASTDYVLVRDEKANGTDGGSPTANTYLARNINTEVSDVGGHCSVASNQITLAAGTYECEILSPFIASNATRIILYNTTDAATTLLGMSNYIGNSGCAFISGRFTIAAQKVFEVRYICQTAVATYGLGAAMGTRASNDNDVEIYTVAKFFKVA